MTDGVEPVTLATAPKQGRWIAPPRKSRWMLQLGAASAVIAQLPNSVRMIAEPLLGKGRSWIAMVALLAVILGFVFYFIVRERRARRLRLEDSALIDGGFGDQYAAEMTIVANGTPLGTDRGVVWFADGVMGFSGKASSFVLAPSDVRFHRKAQPRATNQVARPANAFELLGAPASGYLLIVPLGDKQAHFLEHARHFQLAVPSPDAERYWPPLVPFTPPLTASSSPDKLKKN